MKARRIVRDKRIEDMMMSLKECTVQRHLKKDTNKRCCKTYSERKREHIRSLCLCGTLCTADEFLRGFSSHYASRFEEICIMLARSEYLSVYPRTLVSIVDTPYGVGPARRIGTNVAKRSGCIVADQGSW
jgi:hypothetical protein